jgi:hypothetical protein
MELPPFDERHEALAGWDGRLALRHVPESFDEIILDAYANQTEIPPHLCSLEFFMLAREKLRAGGWLCINVGAFGLRDPVLEAIGTMQAFPVHAAGAISAIWPIWVALPRCSIVVTWLSSEPLCQRLRPPGQGKGHVNRKLFSPFLGMNNLRALQSDVQQATGDRGATRTERD